MTTLMVTVNFPPSSGGIQTHSYEVAKNMAKLGKKIVVLAPSTSYAFEFDKKQEFKVIRMKTKKIEYRDLRTTPFHPLHLTIILLHTVHAVLKRKIVRIYATSWYPCGFVSMIISKVLRIPYFVAVHGLDVLIPQKSKILKTLMVLVLNECKKLIALGSYQQVSLLRLGIPKEKIQVVSEGVDLKKFNICGVSSEIRKAIGEEKKIILTVARLVKRKGHDMVIKSLPNVLQRVPNAVYVIVGTGPEKSNLKRLVNDLGLDRHVMFTGYVSEEDLPKYYNACDVFIMVNREINGDIEGFGIVFLEANACCKPVIGGKSGGTMDAIKDSVTGILVGPTSIKEISDALIMLLTNSDLSKKLGENGRLRVERRFSYLSVAKEVSKILED